MRNSFRFKLKTVSIPIRKLFLILVCLFISGCTTLGIREGVIQQYNLGEPSFSPDGKKMVFAEWSRITPEFGLVYSGKGRPMFTSELTEKRYLPDGSIYEVITPQTKGGNLEVYIMDVEHPEIGKANLTNNPAHDGMPVFSPDGKKIAFCSFRDGNSEIYIMNPDGTEQKRVTKSPTLKTHLAWFPNGKKIQYMGGSIVDMPTLYEVHHYNIDLDGTGEEIAQHVIGSGEVALSPDGKKVAYLLFHKGSPGLNEIFVSNLDDSKQKKLTSIPGLYYHIFWSKDGEKLFFIFMPDVSDWKTRKYFMMNADGSDQKEIDFSKLSKAEQEAFKKEPKLFPPRPPRTSDYWSWYSNFCASRDNPQGMEAAAKVVEVLKRWGYADAYSKECTAEKSGPPDKEAKDKNGKNE